MLTIPFPTRNVFHDVVNPETKAENYKHVSKRHNKDILKMLIEVNIIVQLA